MPVSPVFAFAVPAPHTATFTDGEQALAVASPINTAAGRTTYRLARWFDFEGGLYTFKALADDSAVFISTTFQNSGRVLFTTRFTSGVTEHVFYIPRGRVRLDILLSNISTNASACYTAFSIRYGGRLVYASGAAGWVFDTTPIPDASLPPVGDRRLTFPLFTVTPNWSGGVTERIQYMTEIMSSESDAEQRRSPRRFARRSIEASFMRQGANRARLDNFFVGVGKHEVLVPLWHEQYRLTSTLGSSLTFPEGTLVMREFRQGDLVALIRNPSDFEILTVASHNLATDTITFSAPPSGTWAAGSRIMPIRVARIVDAARFENQTDNVATVQARFEFVDPMTWPEASWGYCSPLFRFKPNRATALSIDFERQVYTLDNETGPVDISDPAQKARVGTRLSLTLRGREEVYRFRQFVAKTRGRAVRFWMPDWMQDIIPATDIAGPHIDAVPAGFSDYIKMPQDARRMIGVEFKDGRPALYREVTTVAKVGDCERFVVDPALPPIEKSEVSRVMFVMPSRFDQDGFELRHTVDDSAVVQTTLVVRSAEIAGLPPIECFTTSKPYPVVASDGLAMGASLVLLSSIESLIESMTISASVQSVTLREILKQYGVPPEALTISASVQSVTLREILRQYGVPPEALTISASMQGGTLRVALIQYTNYQPEGLNISAEILGGTLT